MHNIDKTDVPRIVDLLQKHCVSDDDGCWIWTRSYRGKGYAQLTLSGRRQVQGNRAAYIAYKGPIPDGLYVCHKCDKPACCNPEHLFLGTPADNIRDCVAKGRLRPQNGGKAGRRIAVAELPEIKRLRSLGMKQREIASMYGVTQVRISQLLRRGFSVDS